MFIKRAINKIVRGFKFKMQDKKNEGSLPLIIYLDDNGETKLTYSNYTLDSSTITFTTQQNKITIPITRLIKIKEDKDGF